ncbi:MAG: hypothetical protein ACJ746_02660 [Bryobacteraceae bacterium]
MPIKRASQKAKSTTFSASHADCECAAGFCNDVGYQDDSYFDALVRMFEQAVKIIAQLPASDRNPLIARLDKVRTISHNFGYGVGDDMDSLLAQYVRK